MIASLHGVVDSITPSGAVIDCNGVGYFVRASTATLAQLQRGEKHKVLTTMLVREDAMELIGFANSEEKEMFNLLTSVPKLGPKIALAALSTFGPGEIAAAISRKDSKALQAVTGVGKRLADSIIATLDGKVNALLPAAEQTTAPAAIVPDDAAAAATVTQALEGLGFDSATAHTVVAEVAAAQPGLGQSELLKVSLAALNEHKQGAGRRG